MTWRLDDRYTKSLLHFSGTDASTTFLDESGKTWTASVNAQLDTAQSKFGPSSLYLPGSSSYIYSADSNDWYLDDGSNTTKWTIDCWFKNNTDIEAPICGQYVSDTSFWFLRYNSSPVLNFRIQTASTYEVQFTCPASETAWNHIACVKDGSNGYMLFFNGTQVGTTTGLAANMSNLAATMDIGRIRRANAFRYMVGWIDEFRVTKGIARWTANFTPPARPYQPLLPSQFITE